MSEILGGSITKISVGCEISAGWYGVSGRYNAVFFSYTLIDFIYFFVVVVVVVVLPAQIMDAGVYCFRVWGER